MLPKQALKDSSCIWRDSCNMNWNELNNVILISIFLGYHIMVMEPHHGCGHKLDWILFSKLIVKVCRMHWLYDPKEYSVMLSIYFGSQNIWRYSVTKSIPAQNIYSIIFHVSVTIWWDFVKPDLGNEKEWNGLRKIR